MIGPEGIKMEQEKMKMVLDWLTSTRVKNVQKFLGLAKSFVKDFAFIARLLHDLVKKEQKWECEFWQKKLFEALKKQFTMELVLVKLDLDKKMKIKVDISNYTMGGVLSME